MDTQTILEIIKKIDARIEKLNNDYNEGMNDVEYFSRIGELSDLHLHLQSFIEVELDIAESKTEE